MKILFVCKGNVGRSQIAETLLKQYAPNMDISSAGTMVVDADGKSQDGQKLRDIPAAQYVIMSLKETGVDISDNIRRQLTPPMVKDADKIIIMDEDIELPDYVKKSKKTVYWELKDPKGESFEFTNKVRDTIKKLVKGLHHDNP